MRKWSLSPSYTINHPPPSAIRHPPSAIHPFQVRLEDYLREGSAGDLARALELEGLCGANADDPQARLGLGTWEFVTNCVANLDTAHIDHTVDLVEYSRDAFVRAQTSAHYFGTVLAICPPTRRACRPRIPPGPRLYSPVPYSSHAGRRFAIPMPIPLALFFSPFQARGGLLYLDHGIRVASLILRNVRGNPHVEEVRLA